MSTRFVQPSVRGTVLGLLAAAVIFIARRPAGGDLDIELILGGRVVSRIDPKDEVETFRVALAAGASLTATATPSHGFPALTLRLLDSAGAPLAVGTAKGASSRLHGFVVGASAVYALEVRGSGSDANDYTLALSWKTPGSTKPTVALDAAATAQISFVADAGAKADFSVAAARRSSALPQLVQARHAASGAVIDFAPLATPKKSHSVKSVRLPAGGDWTLEFLNRGGTGDVKAAVVVHQPKPEKKPLKPQTPPQIPVDVAEGTNVVVGPSGGVVTPTDSTGALDGARLDVPRGAVSTATIIQIGSGTDIAPPDVSLGPSGAALFLGPDGFEFKAGVAATATVPFDPESFGDGTDALRVIEQTGAAPSTIVDPSSYQIESVAGRVSFPVTHFTRYQVVRALRETKIEESDLAAGDHYGRTVDLSGDRMVVGAGFHDATAFDGGETYVYARNGPGNWTLEQKLAPAEISISSLFGNSVAIDGDTIVVGAPQQDPGTGAAYVFVRQGTTWSLQQKLTASDGAVGDNFGGTTYPGGDGVAISGDTILVGAPQRDEAGDGSGAAYVFTRSAGVWTQQAKLVPADGAAGDAFAHMVALDGDLAVVPMQKNNTPFGVNGAVYVFARSGTNWSLEKKLVTSGPADQSFGVSAAVSDDTVVVGASTNGEVSGALDGAVYVYTRSAGAWPLQQTVRPIVSGRAGLFGLNVALDGDALVVGDPFSAALGANSGFAHLFIRRRGAWTPRRVFTSSDVAAADLFGFAVEVDGRRAVIGVFNRDDHGGDSGAVYVYEGL